jgi:hypothetical protein
MENKENMIEFITGQHTTTVTFTNGKHIRKIKELYETNKDDFKSYIENADGSICARIPLKWVRISAGRTGSKREMTEEEKDILRQRLAEGRAKSKQK